MGCPQLRIPLTGTRQRAAREPVHNNWRCPLSKKKCFRHMTYRLLLPKQAGEAWEPSKSNALSAVRKHVIEQALQFV